MEINNITLGQAVKMISAITCFLLLVGCPVEDIERPPVREPIVQHVQQVSVIQMPISITAKDVKRAILNELDNPLSAGKTDRLSANIFATESITERELIKVLVSPAQPGYYITKYKEVKQTFKESYKCLLNPFKWGRCWRDVVKIVMVPFELWIEPVEAVYDYASEDITKLIDKTFKTGIWIGHKINLTDLNISFEGRSVKIFSSYKIDLSVDYEQAMVPLGPKVKIKGLLNGDIQVNILLTGIVSINNNAELVIDIPDDGAKIEFTKILIPSAVEAVDFIGIIQPSVMLTKKLVGELANKQIQKQVQKQISKNQGDLIFGEDIQKLVFDHSTPIAISENLWLIPDFKKIAISQINGQGEGSNNTLTINVGIDAQPQLLASSTQPVVNPPNSIPIISEEFNPRIALYPEIILQYDYAKDRIEKELKDLIEKNYNQYPYTIGNVQIYPSNSKLVVSIDLIKRSNNKKAVTLYLWGTPKINRELNYAKIDDLDFTLETRNYLLKIASWILDKEIQDLIKDKAIFNYEKELKKLSSELSKIERPSNQGTFIGEIDSISLENVFTTKEALVVQFLATGKASFLIKLDEPILEVGNNKSLVRTISDDVASISEKSIEASMLGALPNVKSLKVKNYTNKTSMHIVDSLAPPLIKVGDTIYFEDTNGDIKRRTAGPKDITIPGESLLVKGQNGEIQIIKHE